MTLPEINVFVPFVFVFIISIGKTHTSKDEKHLTRHWREIALTSALLWQSIEFITSYNLEYCWPGLCLTHSKKCARYHYHAKPFTMPHIVIHCCLFI